MKYHCVATPEFRNTYFKKGVNKKSILKAPAVIYNKKDKLHTEYLARHYKITDDNFPYHIVPSSEGFVSTALTGAAYALIPWAQFRPFKVNGALVDLVPRKSIGIKLYWQSWYLQTEHTKFVSESVINYAKEVLKR